jgi:hypothetical protein
MVRVIFHSEKVMLERKNISMFMIEALIVRINTIQRVFGRCADMKKAKMSI